METKPFIEAIASNFRTDEDGNVFAGIWNSYEKVVLHSLITSFGLDFLVHDQRGGDVDTIHSVRESGTPDRERYKSPTHQTAYENRGAYDTKAYHSDPRYREMTRSVRLAFNEEGKFIEDAYVPGNTVAPNRSGYLGKERRSNLDHVISAHEIHEDPGRVLAGLDGKDLANSPENLRFTNESLNKSKSDMSVEEYLDSKGDAIPAPVQDQMRKVDSASRAAYEDKLIRAYYSSPDFLSSAAIAAGQRGLEMGVRQAVGFAFVELWFACSEEILTVPDKSEIKDYFHALTRGMEKGLASIKNKHGALLESFGEGFLAGALASLTTTLINIFITTDKTTARNLRQTYAAVVQAGNVLFFNPNELLLGDRLEMTTVILATGANVLIGSAVGDVIAKTPLGADPVIGSTVCLFTSTLVSGLLSCTLLLCLDRSKFINKVVANLNQYLTESQSFREAADKFTSLAAQVAELDIVQFRIDTEKYSNVAEKIAQADCETQLDELLTSVCTVFDIQLPWDGDFDEFMSDPTSKLVIG
jgi:hypothetical protein